MTAPKTISRSQRLKEEFQKYGVISAYLFVCFLAILLYDQASTPGGAVHSLPVGIALVKALVLGKFILIGDAVKVGSRADHHPLLHRVVWKSLALLVLLIVFKIIEELVVGWFHDVSFGQVIEEMLARTWIQNLAPTLLMFLILVPLVTATEVYRLIGSERFRAFLVGRP